MLWLGATHPKTAALYTCRCLQLGSQGTHPAATNSATSTSQLLVVQFSACKTAATVMMMVQDASKMRLLELVLLMRQMFSKHGDSAGLQSKQWHRNTALAQRQHTPLVKMQRCGSCTRCPDIFKQQTLSFPTMQPKQHSNTIPATMPRLRTVLNYCSSAVAAAAQPHLMRHPVQPPSTSARSIPRLGPYCPANTESHTTQGHTHREASVFGSVPRRHHADTSQAIIHKPGSRKIHSLRLSIGPSCGRQ